MKILFTINILFLTVFSFAQDKSKTHTIKTVVDSGSPNQITYIIFDKGLSFAETEITGKTPSDQLILIKRDESDRQKFNVLIDENNNGRLDDEVTFILKDEGKKSVKVTESRKSSIGFYEITSYKYEDKNFFYWRRDQRIRGTIKTKKCSMDFFVLDLNANGKFELGEAGTNFQLDKNKDGKIWGKEEYYFSRELIDICGENFFVSEIDPNGSFVKFTPTNLQSAKVGEKSPYFNLKFMDGRNISSNELLGKKYMLDFWASWCVPCVNKLPEVKDLEKKIAIYYVNTDEKIRVKEAKEIVEKNAIKNNSVLNGLGEDDFIWKSFARLNNALPFYVVIDEKGTIVYAGNGGSELKELKSFVSQ